MVKPLAEGECVDLGIRIEEGISKVRSVTEPG